MAGRITIDLFTTLDGVAQAPGGPDEDTSSGFPYGGWQAPLIDETAGRVILEGIEAMDALVLGTRTSTSSAGSTWSTRCWPRRRTTCWRCGSTRS